MAQAIRSATFNLATILNVISKYPEGITPAQIRENHPELVGYSIKDKIKSRPEYFTTSQERSNRDNKFKVTQAGLDYLEEHKDEIVEDLSTVTPLLAGEGNYKGRRIVAKPAAQEAPASPSYSPTAQLAIESLSVIIDANENARKALESLYVIANKYFIENTVDTLPEDAGMFKAVVDEMNHYRSIMRSVMAIVEPEDSLQGVEDEPSQTSLIE